MRKKSVEKRMSIIERHMLDEKKIDKMFLVIVFYLLSAICLVYPIMYYTLIIHEYNFQSTITFFYMSLGIVSGFSSCLFWMLGIEIKNKKVKL